MQRSESIGKLLPILLKLQKEMDAVKKSADNPFFKSKYADLSSVMENSVPKLNNAGVVVLQPNDADEKGRYVETILLHESGEWISGRTYLIEPKNMQDMGSAITYARRYGLTSLLAMDQEDDDGNKASGKVEKAVAQSTPKQATTTTAPAKSANNVSSFRKPNSQVAPAESTNEWGKD